MSIHTVTNQNPVDSLQQNYIDAVDALKQVEAQQVLLVQLFGDLLAEIKEYAHGGHGKVKNVEKAFMMLTRLLQTLGEAEGNGKLGKDAQDLNVSTALSGFGNRFEADFTAMENAIKKGDTKTAEAKAKDLIAQMKLFLGDMDASSIPDSLKGVQPQLLASIKTTLGQFGIDPSKDQLDDKSAHTIFTMVQEWVNNPTKIDSSGFSGLQEIRNNNSNTTQTTQYTNGYKTGINTQTSMDSSEQTQWMNVQKNFFDTFKQLFQGLVQNQKTTT